jgi:hypothetical protein
LDQEATADLLYRTLRAYHAKNHIELSRAPDAAADRRFVEMTIGLFLDGIRARDPEVSVPSRHKKTK